MKLGGQMDYHGSRTYAPDLPSAPAGSWIKRLTSRFAARAEQMLEMLLKPGAREAAETIWLVDGKERHFSLLGSDGHDQKRRAAPCPFPEGEVRARRPIGHRSNSG